MSQKSLCKHNGSSPLARGTRSNILTGMGLDAVHPRLRGELAIAALPRLFKTGSSPLARGTPTESAAIWTRARFIPACAGNSPMQFAEVVSDPVHPRLRGELLRNLSCIQILAGSSPLARGTQSPGFFCSPQNRFIPACAGNSIELNKPIICSPVHPRLRGELRFHLLGARFLIGSSPLARGTRLNTLGSRFFRRFIPACAGNSQ